MEKYGKKVLAVIVSAVMVLTSVNVPMESAVKAASTENVTKVDARDGIFYESLDIGAYRGEKDTDGNYTSCPQRDGYVFAGWYETSDETSAVSAVTTTGTAWAKFVPEDTLSLKVQTTKKMAENPEQVKFRLVTSVDSLSYSQVGFSVTINGTTKELGSQKVYQQIVVTDPENGSSITDPKTEFCQASEYFATVRISNILNADFDSMEINATPWWITKDGTKVSGIGRSRMLVSDERINDADGSDADFTVSEDTYTYKTDAGSTASYQYFTGGSDTVYLKGTYTTAGANNQFGISIRNGGETRQVFYDGYGVKVVKEDLTTGYADGSAADTYKYITTDDNGVYVWVQANEDGTNIQSAVSGMVNAAVPEAHEVIWAIEKNVLYGSVDGKIFLRMPMEKLSSAWQNGRCYQLGVAGYNVAATDTNMAFTLQKLNFGKKAYKTADTEGLTAETEDLKTSRMAYEPIDGAYVPGSNVAEDGESWTYARTAPKAAGTPVAVETVVENWGENDEDTGVGITIVVNDDDGWNSVQFEMFNTGTVRLQGEYHWYGWNHFFGQPTSIIDKLTSKATVGGSGEEQARIKAAVYDGKFMVLINDVPAYECSMETLFKDKDGNVSYNPNSDTVSLGVVAHDTKRGYTPRFKAVKTYEGQDAIDAKMKTWTLYPNGSYSNVNVGTGSVSDNGGTGWDSIPLVSEENRSKVWQITGTMSHSGAGDAHQGLSIETDGKWFYLLGGNEGFEKWLQSTWCNGSGDTWNSHDHAVYNNYTYNGGDNEYAFVKNSETNHYFNTWDVDGSVTFKAVIVDDTAFVWLNDVFSWMVPLDKAEFDGFDLGTNYRVKLQIGDGDRNQSFENVQVRTDSEVDATLVKNLKACKNFDWHTAYKEGQKTLSTDGVIVERNATGNASDVYSKVTSDTIYASAEYTKLEDKQGIYAVTLKDAAGQKAARFYLDGQGYVQMTGEVSWWNIVDFKSALKEDGSSPTLWAQKKSSAIKNLLDTKTAGTVNRIEWAVADNNLYCKVDGQISCIIPLSDVYAEWTDGTAYSIALAAWNTEAAGKMGISDLEVLFGEDAKAKLPDKATVATGLTGDNTGMVYDALDGAYIATYYEWNRAFYGAAGTAVSVETDMQLLDMATTDGAGAGVSVRLQETGATAEFLAMVDGGQNNCLRTMKNLEWNDSVKHIPYPGGIVPFDKNGYCHMKAEVVGDNIVISFNGQEAYTFALADYLDGYTSGAAVQLGIATNNSDEGITFFRNVVYTSDLQKALDGKYVSILGDSISTFAGVSNDASRNTTIGNNVVEYTGTNCDVTNMYQTYWGQMLKKYNMNLLVNNSSGGNKLWDGDRDENNNIIRAAGYVRVEQLKTNTEYLKNIEPDIILLHMGTNDYIQGNAPGEIYNNIRTAVKVDGAYITPTTFAEAYVITLEKIKELYPKAKVFCFTLSPSNHRAEINRFTLLDEYNNCIKTIVQNYKDQGEKVTLVDTGAVINKDNYTSLTYDTWNPTHPNLAGMTAMAGKLEEALRSVYINKN